ncbi:uncharacterized protein LOC125653733 isoform X3 [Ostrea edulis]|nr:uncharacterized protein LOC125653733 isoform X3 [Ostrea edulis]
MVMMVSSRLSMNLQSCLRTVSSQSPYKKVVFLSAALAISVWLYSIASNTYTAIHHDHCLNWSTSADIVIPDAEQLHQMSLYRISCLYQRYVTSLQGLCTEPKRFGNVEYGGVRICADSAVVPSRGCVIYSYNHELSGRFVKQIDAQYKCSVVFFGNESHTQKNMNFGGFNRVVNNYGHELSVVILKIRAKDFPFLLEFSKSVNQVNVKQIILELHYDRNKEKIGDYVMLLNALRELRASNYAIYWFDRNWEFVENSRTKQRRSKCFTVNMYRRSQIPTGISHQESNGALSDVDLPQIAPIGTKSIEKDTALKYQEWFAKFISKHLFLCKQMLRLGNIVDGGWEVCHDFRFRPKPPCVVYSIGISYDFSFDEDMEKTYGCDVFSFDPSMNTGNYRHSDHIMFYQVGLGDHVGEIEVKGSKWKIKTLMAIMKELGHTNKRIDVLKIDIEGSERQSLVEIMESGALKNVVQLCLEFHSYYDLGAMRKLYDLGFRVFWAHQNPQAPMYTTNETYSYGMEVYFVNINIK